MKETTRTTLIASVCAGLVIFVLFLCFLPIIVDYIHIETEFRSKTEQARFEAKAVQQELQHDARFTNVTTMGVYGFRSHPFGIHASRTVDISFVGKVDAAHIQDLKSQVEGMDLSFPVSWCLTIVTNMGAGNAIRQQGVPQGLAEKIENSHSPDAEERDQRR